ncbi:hypothetical protein AGMMS49975_03680 [Clostridia bacterium]|nr:hypothetical protein AGMMS49975_03680 [Clostridia bacterium]
MDDNGKKKVTTKKQVIGVFVTALLLVLVYAFVGRIGAAGARAIAPEPLPANNLTSAVSLDGLTEATFAKVNSWEENGKDCTQFTVSVRNVSENEVVGWAAEMKFPRYSVIKDSWNGVFAVSGDGTLSIKNVDYNRNISVGGVQECGFIIAVPKDAALGAEEVPLTPPEPIAPKDEKTASDDWLHAKGNRLYDGAGQEVWLTGLNWFGYNTGSNIFDGLWTADAEELLQAVADRGFNIIRVPFSAELLNRWAAGDYPEANYNRAVNARFNGMNSLQIFDYLVDSAESKGLKFLIDIHSAKTDPMGHMKPIWTDGDITEEKYLAALSWVAERYKGDDTIIAYDLKNEPHGTQNETPRAKWDDSKDADNWRYVAEKAANAVLSKNPNALVLVEGVEIFPMNVSKGYTDDNDYYYNWWGGNLRGVRYYPVELGEFSDKLVYSPHDYGPAVYMQSWFIGGYTYDSLYKDVWQDNFMFIHEKNIAPLLIGEWGGFMSEPNLKWMTYMRELISTYRINHTYWCLNANSGDTGGLLRDDFVTWDEEKYEFLEPVLWQQDGRFVGLSHTTPLGKNGISLNEYK